MTSSKSFYSRCFKEYELHGEALARLQQSLLEMFLDIKSVFDRHGIKYMAGGGTLLGAIRHHGFIPWDDDIDLLMLRSEFLKFRHIFEAELGEKYELVLPMQDEYVICKQPKVYKKNTSFVELSAAGVPAHNKLFLDIFIIENVPSSKLLRKLRAGIYDFAFRAASVCADYRFPSPVIEEKARTDEELGRYYSFRKRLGAIFSHLGGMRFYLSICEKLGKMKRYTGTLGIPSAISYQREIFPARVFEELSTGDFCGYEISIPKNYDVYLKNLYRDYMQIPPEEKREFHCAYKIQL